MATMWGHTGLPLLDHASSVITQVLLCGSGQPRGDTFAFTWKSSTTGTPLP